MLMWQSSGLHLAAPIPLALDDHGHGSPGTSNHNTTFKRPSEGSTNGNVDSQIILLSGRESPHIAKEENPTDFMRIIHHEYSNGEGSRPSEHAYKINIYGPRPWKGKQTPMTCQ
eukprot:7059836-Ditylum_brightwellii.AAC.1